MSLLLLLLYQTLMSVHWAITPVPTTAITHQALTPVAVDRDTPWMLMDISAMVIAANWFAFKYVG